MKRALTTINFSAWTIALIGFGLKLTLLASGSVLLLIGLGAAALCCTFLAFLPSQLSTVGGEKTTDGRFDVAYTQVRFFSDSIAPKIVFLSSAIAAIGILFRLMNWEGSAKLLIVGGGSLIVVSTVLLIQGIIRPYAVLLGMVSGVLFFVSRKDIVQLFHRNDPVLVEKMNYQLDHPRDEAAAEAVRQHLLQHPVGK